MGAEFRTTTIEAEDTQELGKKFQEVCEEAAYMSGHGGYTGTFAEKRGQAVFVKSYKPVSYEEAREEGMNASKWGPAWAYCVGDNQWYVCAWCSL